MATIQSGIWAFVVGVRPAGIYKAAQMAAGLALPADSAIEPDLEDLP